MYLSPEPSTRTLSASRMEVLPMSGQKKCLGFGLKVKGVAVDRNDVLCLCFGFGHKRCVFWRLAFGNLGYEPM